MNVMSVMYVISRITLTGVMSVMPLMTVVFFDYFVVSDACDDKEVLDDDDVPCDICDVFNDWRLVSCESVGSPFNI
jgi:hypothetical protein